MSTIDPELLFASSESEFNDEEDYLPFPATRRAPAARTRPSPAEIPETASLAVESPEFRVLTKEAKLSLVTLYFLCERSYSGVCQVGKLGYFCGIESPYQFSAILAELEHARWITRDGENIVPERFGSQLMGELQFAVILDMVQRMITAVADLNVKRRFS